MRTLENIIGLGMKTRTLRRTSETCMKNSSHSTLGYMPMFGES